ncbi:ABC transporter ATP-binding protein [Paenibacillus chitinolyticus]|uniref:ABC transporter ATP-binding protein n=1 Tax=Paenibacillus chitinolyticus TaxID=79263 RepID=A0A410WUW0_9BACL|nr:ABC transporter ATP-binding protein [Paenibacillus chitinolyticus]MCY9589568.1 ABC transporter ATP-binding protein/permease [Paenibacillus chitinolyticus]MCY9599154.1 ABC transporter ATP-binding protein/permease [Paenibacillus chitinolyticus]QAV18120.1 ABC transporter ATP-binding protein [Paenibacillus chitinolyticus]
MGSQRLLRNYVKANLGLYSVGVAFIILSNVVQSFFPRVLGEFTDDLQLKVATSHTVAGYSLQLLGIGVAYGVLFGIGQYTNARLGRRFEYATRQKLFRHFSTLSEHYFSRHGVGKLLSYVMNDVTAVRESISNGVNQTTNAIFFILSAFVMMSFSSIPFGLIALSLAPMALIPFIVVFLGPRIRSRSLEVQESLATMTESAEEQFGGIRVTKTFAAEEIAYERFGRNVDDIREKQLRLVRMSSLFQSLLPLMGSFSMIIAILAGGYMTLHGQITLGSFVSLTFYLRMMMTPLQQIGNVINMMQRSRASLERLNHLLAVKPDIREEAKAAHLENGAGELEIRGLSFCYPGSDRRALEAIDLKVEPGRTLGIIGRTGSGKTTLVKLLLRIYDPPAGTIYIGGHDIRRVTLESLRSQIAYVPQDGFLFSTTIRDNIAFSRRDAADDEMQQAAREAQIYSSITELPRGFETKLGERGITLSGGQRQRASLARGFMKRAPILILDDSVSAVDAVTETNIVRQIRAAHRDKTTLIIAHRISAVKHADEIIVLDEGRIVQRGTHKELLALPGLYASLYQIQEEGTRHA